CPFSCNSKEPRVLNYPKIRTVGMWLVISLCLSLGATASPEVRDPGADNREILRLQGLAGVKDKLPAMGASTEAMVLALASLSDTVQNAGGDMPGDWKPQDYDALFALLQNYREQIKAARARMAQLEARGAS